MEISHSKNVTGTGLTPR